jgi:hypothetical protein
MFNAGVLKYKRREAIHSHSPLFYSVYLNSGGYLITLLNGLPVALSTIKMGTPHACESRKQESRRGCPLFYHSDGSRNPEWDLAWRQQVLDLELGIINLFRV